MMRRVELNLFGLPDLGLVRSLVVPGATIRIFEQGKPLPSGSGHYRENAVCISIEGDLPDGYEARIDQLISAFGGDRSLSVLMAAASAKDAWIRIVAPVRSSSFNEEGTLSTAFVQRIAGLGLGLEFWCT